MIARGNVVAVHANLLKVRLPGAAVGTGVRIETTTGNLGGRVCALDERHAVVEAFDGLDGVRAGDAVYDDPWAQRLPLGTPLLGRAIDACGLPLDGGPVLRGNAREMYAQPPRPSARRAIAQPFWTGIRAVDAFTTIGQGARMGIFGPPGCGKSSLLRSLTHGCAADAVVVGLIGERGREAEEWIRELTARVCVVCATSDRSATQRILAARVAVAQAATLAAAGLHVLLIVDSLARYAQALRESAVARGESVGRGGYPPSVFATLATVVEAAGNTARGSATLVATVLSDGDERDPVSEAVRSLLDGHIMLSPKRANAGCFPAIDVTSSLSRTMNAVIDDEHARDAAVTREALALLAQSEDSRSLGIIPEHPATLRAVAAEEALEGFLRQGNQPVAPGPMLHGLRALADMLR
jgi:FliI/YscN family ATPase